MTKVTMSKETMNLERLKTGDFLLFEGGRFVSSLVGIFSDSFSHIAMVVKTKKNTYFLHSTPNPANIESISGKVHSGVILTKAEDSLQSGIYKRCLVLRIHNLKVTKESILSVLSEYGKGYETQYLSFLFPSCFTGTESLYCTEFMTFLLRDTLGCSIPKGKLFYPSDILCLEGIKGIGFLETKYDFKRWWCDHSSSSSLSKYERLVQRQSVISIISGFNLV